jgi:hypothetical protein
MPGVGLVSIWGVVGDLVVSGMLYLPAMYKVSPAWDIRLHGPVVLKKEEGL